MSGMCECAWKAEKEEEEEEKSTTTAAINRKQYLPATHNTTQHRDKNK